MRAVALGGFRSGGLRTGVWGSDVHGCVSGYVPSSEARVCFAWMVELFATGDVKHRAFQSEEDGEVWV